VLLVRPKNGRHEIVPGAQCYRAAKWPAMSNVLLIEPQARSFPVHSNSTPVPSAIPDLVTTELMNRLASIMRLSGRLPGRSPRQ
jgi:hypothetical protein